ncbi:MAG: VWA domain-containing protein [Acidobacteriaceae bacterium]
MPAPAVVPPPPALKGPLILDVVATDKAGHPVPGLTKDDFTLLDNGQPTPITAFTAVASASSTAASPESIPTQAVVVVDEVNTSFIAVSVERTQLHNFLTANQGHLPFPVTILFLTDTGIKQVNQPTSDGNALDAKLQQEQGTLREIPRSAGFYGGTDRLQISIKSLHSILSTLDNEPGKKLVIWISQGWWIFNSPNVYIAESQRRAFFQTVVALSAELQQGQITLDSVDPLGTEDASNMRNFEWQDFLKPVAAAKKADPGDLALQVLSTHSGGQVLFGNNDIASEITKCITDGTVAYRLAFNPPHADAPDSWHNLQVKLDKPGLKARARNGYYAEP